MGKLLLSGMNEVKAGFHKVFDGVWWYSVFDFWKPKYCQIPRVLWVFVPDHYISNRYLRKSPERLENVLTLVGP